ncbi:MAG: FAD-dependent oxidoreductase [Planctomycetota bacterium]
MDARPTHRIEWYRTPVDPPLLRELSQSSDIKGLVQAGGHLALTVVLGVLTWWVAAEYAWYWAIPCLLVYSSVFNMLGSGVHELVHERVFATRWINGVFLDVISFFNWWNPRFFILSHNEHHKFTLHQPDDLEVTLPMKVTPLGFTVRCIIWPLHPVMSIWKTLRMALGIRPTTWEAHILGRVDAKARRGVRNFSRAQLVGHLAIIVYSVYSGHWVLPLLTTFAGFYAQWLMLLLGGPQHIGLVDRVNDFRLCCRTFTTNPLFTFLYWRMNFHIEHHMYPVVPCYNLPRLHAAIKHDLPRTPHGLYDTWVDIAYIINRQVHEPDYQYRAPLPSDPEFIDPVHGQVPPRPPAPAEATDVAAASTVTAKVWECGLCGFIYDEAEGLPDEGIAPGTTWAQIPDDWTCPVCGVAKAQFRMIEITRAAAAAKRAADPEAANPDTFADPIVVVGTGLAGYGLARELRQREPRRPMILVTRDGGESYYKPLLSNALAQGTSTNDLILASAESMASTLSARLLTHTTVRSIDRAAKTLVTDTQSLKYHKLVLATGADPIRLPLQGDAADAVYKVNDLDDFRRWAQALTPGGRVVVIGAGLIGCEFANDLSLGGYRVQVVDVADNPLARLLPPSLGRDYADGLAQAGVRWQLGVSVSSVDHGEDGVLRCTLSDGRVLEADTVLSAVGLRPRTGLADAAGLDTDRGVLTDRFLATSDPDIFALGDGAQVEGQVLPYVAPIMHQTRALAKTLAGTPTAVDYPVMPVVVKTPSCPAVVLPVSPSAEGEWTADQEAPDAARFISPDGQTLGFALIRGATSRADALAKEVASDPAVAV